jgi:hypothetical protein
VERGYHFAGAEEDERKHQESDQKDDFGPSEPKFRFSVEADRHEVHTDDHDEHNGDPDCDVNVVSVVDDQACSGDLGGSLASWKQEGCQACFTFIRHQNAKSIPVQITHRKTRTP